MQANYFLSVFIYSIVILLLLSLTACGPDNPPTFSPPSVVEEPTISPLPSSVPTNVEQSCPQVKFIGKHKRCSFYEVAHVMDGETISWTYRVCSRR